MEAAFATMVHIMAHTVIAMLDYGKMLAFLHQLMIAMDMVSALLRGALILLGGIYVIVIYDTRVNTAISAHIPWCPCMITTFC
jgi:hypothetical protein